MLVGGAVILALNLIRVMSLYLVGVHFPNAFNTVHEEIWSVLLVIATVCLTITWIGWARRDEEGNNDAA